MEPTKRQVAHKVRLGDLASGEYVRVEGEWEPNHVKTPDGRIFSRANIIAVVASDPESKGNYSSFTLDDGTAQIPVRIFDDIKANVSLGDVILVIGRPREFGGQIYLAPEIIKKVVNKRWIDYRRLELANLPELKEARRDETPKPQKPIEVKPEIEEIIEKPKEPKTNEISPVDEIINIIRELDKEDGADTEEVIETTTVKNAEELIDNLLKEGEIFEISSGKLKVLE